MTKFKVGLTLLGKFWWVTMSEDGKSITDITTYQGQSYYYVFTRYHNLFLSKALEVIAEAEKPLPPIFKRVANMKINVGQVDSLLARLGVTKCIMVKCILLLVIGGVHLTSGIIVA